MPYSIDVSISRQPSLFLNLLFVNLTSSYTLIIAFLDQVVNRFLSGYLIFILLKSVLILMY